MKHKLIIHITFTDLGSRSANTFWSYFAKKEFSLLCLHIVINIIISTIAAVNQTSTVCMEVGNAAWPVSTLMRCVGGKTHATFKKDKQKKTGLEDILERS